MEMWYYLGEDNRFFHRGNLYEIEVEVEKHGEQLTFTSQFTNEQGFVVSKEYPAFGNFIGEWVPAKAVEEVDKITNNMLQRLYQCQSQNKETLEKLCTFNIDCKEED